MAETLTGGEEAITVDGLLQDLDILRGLHSNIIDLRNQSHMNGEASVAAAMDDLGRGNKEPSDQVCKSGGLSAQFEAQARMAEKDLVSRTAEVRSRYHSIAILVTPIGLTSIEKFQHQRDDHARPNFDMAGMTSTGPHTKTVRGDISSVFSTGTFAVAEKIGRFAQKPAAWYRVSPCDEAGILQVKLEFLQ